MNESLLKFRSYLLSDVSFIACGGILTATAIRPILLIPILSSVTIGVLMLKVMAVNVSRPIPSILRCAASPMV